MRLHKLTMGPSGHARSDMLNQATILNPWRTSSRGQRCVSAEAGHATAYYGRETQQQVAVDRAAVAFHYHGRCKVIS